MEITPKALLVIICFQLAFVKFGNSYNYYRYNYNSGYCFYGYGFNQCPQNCYCSGQTARCSNVEEFPQFPNCTERIYLNGNCYKGYGDKCLRRIQKEDLVNLTGLNVFHITNTRIETIPEGIFDDFTNLTDINFSGNRLTLSQGLDYFQNLTSLRRLSLSNNYINNIQKGLFRGMEELEYLDLSYNNLECVLRNTFKDLKSLREINLSNNGIKYVEHFSFNGPADLEVINLGNNSLKSLKENTFSEVRHLQDLYLNDNKLDCTCSTYNTVEKLLRNNVFIEGTCGQAHGINGTMLVTVSRNQACQDDQCSTFETEEREVTKAVRA